MIDETKKPVGKKPKTATDKQPEKASPPPPPRRPTPEPASSGLSGAVWSALALIVVLGGSFATKTLWLPYVVDYLPRANSAGPEKIDTDRIAKLERELKKLRDSGAAISDLEQERARLDESLSALMARLSEVEGKLDDVRKMTDITAPPTDAVGTAESLQRLSERVAGLSEGGEALDVVLQRLAKLEQSIVEQEKTTATESARQTVDQPLVLVIGSLRESLKTDQPFAPTLAAIKRLGGDEPDVERVVKTLTPYAADGIPTLATLREDYADAARAIDEVSPVAGDGLAEQTLNRIKSLVTVRRVDGDGGDQVTDGPVTARNLGSVWQSLEQGDLDKAIKRLATLQGPSLAAAQPWLDKAQARLQADSMISFLNVLAVSLLVPAGQ